jgi:Uncharacterised nucleotidyltransferase
MSFVLDSARLQTLAVNGWAIARLYPDPGLRHYGDLDLCVRVRDYTSAEELLEEDATKGIWIDLHQGAAALDCETKEELFARSILVPAGKTSVRIPSPEDHLRISVCTYCVTAHHADSTRSN